MRPLVARLAGSAERVSYTTGPATRRALASAGALGATTGSVVHLARPPQESGVDVVAHELAHARQPVGRPRFLLRAPDGALDAEERAARSIGESVSGAASSVSGTAASAVSNLTSTADGMTAGIVGRLQVGSASPAAVAEVAGAAARSAVATALEQASQANSMFAAAARAGQAQAADLASGIVPAASSALATGTSAAENAVTAAGAVVQGGATQAGAQAAGEVGAVARNAAQAAAALSGPDLDRVVQAVEEKLLRQIERRGGRYAGVF